MSHHQCCCTQVWLHLTICGGDCPPSSNPYVDIWTPIVGAPGQTCPVPVPVGTLLQFFSGINGSLGIYDCETPESCCYEYTGDCVEQTDQLPPGAVIAGPAIAGTLDILHGETCDDCCPVQCYKVALPCPIQDCTDPDGPVYVLCSEVEQLASQVVFADGEYCYTVGPGSDEGTPPDPSRIVSLPGSFDDDCEACCFEGCWYVAGDCPQCPDPGPDLYIACDAVQGMTGEYVFKQGDFCQFFDFSNPPVSTRPSGTELLSLPLQEEDCPTCCEDPVLGCEWCNSTDCPQLTSLDFGTTINECDQGFGPYTVTITNTRTGNFGVCSGAGGGNTSPTRDFDPDPPPPNSGWCEINNVTAFCGTGGTPTGVCSVFGPQPAGWYICADWGLFGALYKKGQSQCPGGVYNLIAIDDQCDPNCTLTPPATISLG